MNRIKKIGDKSYSFTITLLTIAILMSACASKAESDELVATFDGNECKWEGPTELPVGEHSIIFINSTDKFVEFLVRKIIGEGIIYQDYLDFQPAPGEYFVPPGDWHMGMGKFQLERDEKRDAYIYTFSFDSSGEYFSRVYAKISSDEEGMLLCGPLTIVESSTE